MMRPREVLPRSVVIRPGAVRPSGGARGRQHRKPRGYLDLRVPLRRPARMKVSPRRRQAIAAAGGRGAKEAKEVAPADSSSWERPAPRHRPECRVLVGALGLACPRRSRAGARRHRPGAGPSRGEGGRRCSLGDWRLPEIPVDGVD